MKKMGLPSLPLSKREDYWRLKGGLAIAVDQKAGGKLIVSTNALEVSGTNSKGQFSIKDGVSKNYELDDGSGLIVMEDTQAIDTILDEHATMQSLGKDTGTSAGKCGV